MSDLLDRNQSITDDELNPGQGHYKQVVDNLKNRESGSNLPTNETSNSSVGGEDSLDKGSLATAEKNSNEVDGESFYKKNNLNTKNSRVKAKVKKAVRNKLLVGGLVGGSGFVIMFAIILLVMIGAQKLPDVMQNIEAYQFANATSDLAQSGTKITEEALSADATNPSTWQALKDKYTAYGDPAKSMWSSLDKYRPNKILQNLSESGDLKLNYKLTAFGNKQWVGGVVDGVEFKVAPVEGIGKWVPGINRLLQSRNAAVTRGKLLTAIMNKEEVSGLGTIVKGKLFLNLLEATDGSLSGWLLNKFQNKNNQPMTDQQALDEASLQTEQATQQAITVADSAATSSINQAVSTEEALVVKDAQNPTLVAQAVKAGQDTVAATESMKAVNGSLLKSTLGVVDPIYAIAVPICIIYDGSVVNSGPPIANQTAEQEDTFNKLAAEADQQKQGDTNLTDSLELSNAVKGTNAQLGDITSSVPYQRASGATINTASIPSPEAGADGGYAYSILDALAVPPSVGNFLNKGIQPICQALTNTYLAAGIAVANLVSIFASRGATAVDEETAGQAAKVYVKTLSDKIISRVTDSYAKFNGTADVTSTIIDASRLAKISRVIKFGFSGVKKVGLQIAGITGATLLAHMIVAERSGAGNNGYAQGVPLVDQVDSGANIEANEVERTQLFGRPLTTPEIGSEIQNSNHLVAQANATKSFSQRYFALSNADSLLSHVGLALSSYLSPSILDNFLRFCASLLNPVTYFSSILSVSGVVHASVNPLDQVYGNIQFGWTQQEKDLINSGVSYYPLENQKIIDESGQETAIAKQYAPCFGYVYNPSGDGNINPSDPNGDLTPASGGTSAGSLATLITTQAIVRDSSGNVMPTGGTCSPQNLGSSNNLVFRWRLAMNYDATLGTLTNEQVVN